MRVTLLAILAVLAIACDSADAAAPTPSPQWRGLIYPPGAPTQHEVGVYETLAQCRARCRTQLWTLREVGARGGPLGTYECGRDCSARDGWWFCRDGRQ